MTCINSALDRQCILNQHPFREIQAKRAVGRHMAIDKRGQRAQVLLFHLLQLPGLGEHLLDEQRIDIHQADLEQVERECRQLLLIQAVSRKVAALAVEDETVGPIPVLDERSVRR